MAINALNSGAKVLRNHPVLVHTGAGIPGLAPLAHPRRTPDLPAPPAGARTR